MRRGSYKNGKKEGRWSEWSEEGKLAYSFGYIDDKENGKCITRFKNGKKQSEVLYNYGIKSGIEKSWNQKGNPIYENNWKDGLRDGAQIVWGKSGLILHKHRYSKGVLHGEFIEYYDDGQKSITGNYRFGKKHGSWTYIYKDGVVALSGNYSKGIPKGSWFWIRANKSEMVNVDAPETSWVNKRIREWEKVYN
jgi:antitoxin component YwqK of YwqJK toxin-antitoxin module